MDVVDVVDVVDERLRMGDMTAANVVDVVDAEAEHTWARGLGLTWDSAVHGLTHRRDKRGQQIKDVRTSLLPPKNENPVSVLQSL